MFRQQSVAKGHEHEGDVTSTAVVTGMLGRDAQAPTGFNNDCNCLVDGRGLLGGLEHQRCVIDEQVWQKRETKLG